MLRRAIGYIADDRTGGSTLDILRAAQSVRDRGPATIPVPDTFWPVDGFSVDSGRRNLNRNSESRGVRGNMPEQEFRRAPTVTVRGRIYLPVLKMLLRYISGGTPRRTGTSPAAITTAYEPVGFGDELLPAVHIGAARDNIYELFAGCQLTRLVLTFSNDEFATYEATWAALYTIRSEAALPAAAYDYTYIDPDWAMLLRDAQGFQARSPTALRGLRSYSLTFDNGFREPDFDAGMNVLVVPAAGGDRERRLWYPASRRLGAAQSVTGQLMFKSASHAEESKLDLAKSEQFVFEVEGGSIATTPASRQMLRVTAHNQQYTGGGPADGSREEDITATYDFGAYINSVGKDITFEVVDDD